MPDERHLLYSSALKDAIELRCVSHRKLSRRLGISLRSLRAYTCGYRYPRKVTHLALCNVLLVDLPYVLPERNRWLGKVGMPVKVKK